MFDDGGDGDDPERGGFSEAAAQGFGIADRRARVAALSDADLLYFHRALNNPKVVGTSPWLALFDEEIKKRGLQPPN